VASRRPFPSLYLSRVIDRVLLPVSHSIRLLLITRLRLAATVNSVVSRRRERRHVVTRWDDPAVNLAIAPRGLAPLAERVSSRVEHGETRPLLSLSREPLLQLPEFRSFRAILATVLRAASRPRVRISERS